MSKFNDKAQDGPAPAPSALPTELAISTVLQAPITGLMATTTDDPDTLAQKIMFLERLKEWSKQLIADAEESIRVEVAARGGVQVGEFRYWSGIKKSDPKCVSLRDAAREIMETVGGDWDAFVSHLSAGAIKPGQAKRTLGEEKYKTLWRVEEKSVLETDKPAPKLMKMNPEFAR